MNVVAVTHTDIITSSPANTSTSTTNNNSNNPTTSNNADSGDGHGSTTNSRFSLLFQSLTLANPLIEVINTPFGAIEPSIVIHTRKHQPLSQPSQGNISLNAPSPNPSPGPSSSPGAGAGAGPYPMVFRAHKPFHPSRLDMLLRRLVNGKTGSMESTGKPDDLSIPIPTLDGHNGHNDGDSLEHKGSVCDRIVRIKGVMWLAPYADNQVTVTLNLPPPPFISTPTLE